MTRALRARMLAAVALLAAVVACALVLTDAAREVELDAVDARFGLRGERPPGDLVVVGVDDVTFDTFGERWPFSRNRFAAVLEQRRRRPAARDRLRRPVHRAVAERRARTTG